MRHSSQKNKSKTNDPSSRRFSISSTKVPRSALQCLLTRLCILNLWTFSTPSLEPPRWPASTSRQQRLALTLTKDNLRGSEQNGFIQELKFGGACHHLKMGSPSLLIARPPLLSLGGLQEFMQATLMASTRREWCIWPRSQIQSWNDLLCRCRFQTHSRCATPESSRGSKLNSKW